MIFFIYPIFHASFANFFLSLHNLLAITHSSMLITNLHWIDIDICKFCFVGGPSRAANLISNVLRNRCPLPSHTKTYWEAFGHSELLDGIMMDFLAFIHSCANPFLCWKITSTPNWLMQKKCVFPSRMRLAQWQSVVRVAQMAYALLHIFVHIISPFEHTGKFSS